MDSRKEEGVSRPKRSDVGYKRPPVETRFQKGQKPPPRKKKVQAGISAKEVLWKVLQERRRVIIEGKAVWLTNAELICRRAFLEAERGSPVLGRLLNQLLMQADEPDREEMPEIIIVPDEECGGYAAGTMTIRDGPPE
jgi:hypothetical protein